MSTRCVVHFGDNDNKKVGSVYIHSDGYPESNYGIPARLSRFFSDVEEQTRDTRFSDPSYLAAKFVVWAANQYSSDKDKYLDFLSVGVVNEEPGDINYRYFVQCQKEPLVTWEEV